MQTFPESYGRVRNYNFNWSPQGGEPTINLQMEFLPGKSRVSRDERESESDEVGRRNFLAQLNFRLKTEPG